jgi:uncharacterized membrane protein YbhN (UPF0104 family)
VSGRARLAFRWAIGIALLAVVLWWFDVASIGARLAGVDAVLAVPAILGLVAIHGVAALSWRRLTDRLAGVKLGRRTTMRLYYAAQALGTVTPANVGADLFRVAAVNVGVGRARLAVPVIVQRLASIVALGLLGVAGAVALPLDGSGASLTPVLVVGVVAGLGVVGVAAGVAWRGRRSPRLARWLGTGAGEAPDARWLGAAALDGVGLMLVFHGASLLFGLALVAAVDPAAVGRPTEVLAALAVARLSLAVPVSPNGIGLQEGALSLLFVHLGLPGDVAVAAALLNRVALLVTAALGSIALAAGPRAGRPAVTSESAADRADPSPAGERSGDEPAGPASAASARAG